MAKFIIDNEIVHDTNFNRPITHSRDYLTKQSIEQHRQSEKILRKSRRQIFFKRTGVILRLLLLISCFILFIRIFSRLRGGDSSLSFTGFLEFLSNLNSFDINIDLSDFTIGGDWGIIDGLRRFFNIFGYAFGVLVWVCSNVFNVINYVFQFVRFLLV